MLDSLFHLSLNKCLNVTLLVVMFFIITRWLTTVHGVHLFLRFTEAEKPEFLTDLYVITEVQNHGKYLIKEGKEVSHNYGVG